MREVSGRVPATQWYSTGCQLVNHLVIHIWKFVANERGRITSWAITLERVQHLLEEHTPFWSLGHHQHWMISLQCEWVGVQILRGQDRMTSTKLAKQLSTKLGHANKVVETCTDTYLSWCNRQSQNHASCRWASIEHPTEENFQRKRWQDKQLLKEVNKSEHNNVE